MGVAGAAIGLGGVGTYAQLTDEEQNTFSFTAGGIDGTVEWGGSYNGQDIKSFNDGLQSQPNVVNPSGSNEGGAGIEADFVDVKPGDFGCFSFKFQVQNNPAWVAACIAITRDVDGEEFGPEAAIEDPDGDGDYEQGPDGLTDRNNEIQPNEGDDQDSDNDY
jgi:predicted ribosomally synthesized peptide with SipW-like signal peptide